MIDYSDVEPLISDHRLERIEAIVRLKHPTLPDEAVFVTARVGRMGHLILMSPVPGVPEPFRMRTTRRVPLSTFERFERDRGHYVTGGTDDPIEWVYDELARDMAQRLANAAEMIHPET